MIILQSKKGTAQKYLQVMLNFAVERKHMSTSLLLTELAESFVAGVNANVICRDWFK